MREVILRDFVDLTTKKLECNAQVISLLEGDDEDGDNGRISRKPKREAPVISLLEENKVDSKSQKKTRSMPKKRNKSKHEAHVISLLGAGNIDPVEVRRFNVKLAHALKSKASTMWKNCDEKQIKCADERIRPHIIQKAMTSIIAHGTKISVANVNRVPCLGNTFQHMVRGIHP